MDSIESLVKVTLPKYLQSLPIPKSFNGFSKLSSNQLGSLALFSIIVFVVIYAILKLLVSLVPKKPPPPLVNRKITKDNPKVVDLVEIEDLAEKLTYCRCWKSSKFPLCDGSHNKHNEETGDNVGPLIIRPKEK